ncbi:MAG TPA: hypothetical protein VFB98_07785 [Candidatus Deferrimicrobium sp.]|nr:hypothetical protein [Candidatus Deferrimicrobium sp.]
MTRKIAEGTSEITGNVNTTEDMKVTLKVSFSDKMKEITFKPLEDLKIGDTVKVIVEKITEGSVGLKDM